MADTGIFCTTAEVQRKAGANASSVANVEAYINDFVTQAESFINAHTRYNWSDKYTTLNVDVKGVLKEVASDIAATYVINYDLSGYSQREVETILDILNNSINRGLARLKDIKVQTFINDA